VTPKPRGLLVPISTPFDPATGDVAPEVLGANARAYLDAGVDGILAAGSTGEAALLSDDEFREVVACLRDAVPGDKLLFVGTGKESTRATIKACRTATDEGADYVLVRPPAYYGSTLSPAALVSHFRRVADESPTPVLLYNIPKYTHVALADSLLAALAEHPNVVGAKDSSGDIKNFAAYRAAAPGWALFMGNASLYQAALDMGAVGGVLAAACFAWSLALKIGQAFAGKDRVGASAAQETLTPLNKEIVSTLGVPGIKIAMDVAGLGGGPVRPPLEDLSRKDRTRVADLLRGAGLGALQAGAR